jgi:hypothetical protein
MRFDAGTRTRIIATIELDFDPTGSTVEVAINGTWYPATWQGTPVSSAGKWTQAARTTGYFAGPEVAAGSVAGATVLAVGVHPTQTRVTSGSDIIVADANDIGVG